MLVAECVAVEGVEGIVLGVIPECSYAVVLNACMLALRKGSGWLAADCQAVLFIQHAVVSRTLLQSRRPLVVCIQVPAAGLCGSAVHWLVCGGSCSLD